MTKKAAGILYFVLTATGVLIGFYLSFRIGYLMFGFIYLAIALMLYFYSSDYQKIAFLGNLTVSLLSAMVIIIVWLYEFFALRSQPALFAKMLSAKDMIVVLTGGYAVFAFLTSMIREIIKDIEDKEGDRKAGYKTIPVIYGAGKAKTIVVLIILLTMAALALGQYFLFRHNLMMVFWYLLIAVQSLFVYLIYLIIKAREKEDYKSAGDAAKIIMVAGILSMQLFCIS